MSFIGQVTNINQTMYVPAHIVAEHIGSIKFADELSKLEAKEKEDKIKEIRKIEESQKTDTNTTKDEYREYAKDTLRHINLKG